MKKKIFLGAFALVSLCLGTLTSCSEDDDPKFQELTIKLEEIGAKNSKEATIGRAIHLEGTIVALAKIKEIKAEILNGKGEVKSSEAYGSNPKYAGKINAEFHEHLKVPAELEPGKYTLRFSVTDMDGQTKTERHEITLKAPVTGAPVIEDFSVSPMEATPGSKITVKAKVTVTAPVDEVEVEFHGGKEFPIEIEDYKGKTGTFMVEKEIVVPVEASAGEYHVHFTVKDTNKKETTKGVKDFKIK